jgi:hypothetical protein
LVEREKLHGRWLFHAPSTSIKEALNQAQAAVGACLDEWLLGHNPYLAGAAAKRTPELAIGRSALELLLRELARQRRLGTLALLNASYQPYLAVFQLEDAGEVARQLGTLREVLGERGWVTRRDFPTPQRAVAGKAWRDVLLRHGEWLGLGFIDDEGALVAWG